MGKCQVCSSESKSQCSGCFNAFYCGNEHQKADWKSHKKACLKGYEVVEDPLVGRLMVARRDLKPGEVILKEKPGVFGPPLMGNKPLCVNCFKDIAKNTHKKCPKCKLPFCSDFCVGRQNKEECDIFKQCPLGFYAQIASDGKIVQRRDLDPENGNYQLLLPVKTMLLKKRDPKKYVCTVHYEQYFCTLGGGFQRVLLFRRKEFHIDNC